MPSCVFRQCKNYTTTVKDKNVSFHVLPKDEILKEKWVNVIRVQRREDDWLPTPYATVCTKHFLASDIYTTTKNYRKIKKTAVPVIMSERQYIVPSPTSLEDVELSDEDSIFDTPRKSIWTNKIRKISLEKRKLQLKNYDLVRKNKRLKKKCNYLLQLVSKLRRKFAISVDQFNELKQKQ